MAGDQGSARLVKAETAAAPPEVNPQAKKPEAAVPVAAPVAAPMPVAAPVPVAASGSAAAAEKSVSAPMAAPKAGREAVSPDMTAADAQPVDAGATWEQVKALAHYMAKTEVHTYAFSVAAQVILALSPFIVLLLTISKRLLHSNRMADVVGEMMGNFLPNHQQYVIGHMQKLAFGHTQTKVFSVVMLFITVTGVFLPLEVALNSVWGVTKNRNYLQNQVVSIGLAVGVASLALVSVALSAAQRTVLGILFFGHTDNIVFDLIAKGFLQICALAASIGLFFLIYWVLPNRKVPPAAVLPTAIVMGCLWTIAKYIYILALPHLDFDSVYGPFNVSVSLITWAFISGLLLLAGAYVSATRQALRETRAAEAEREPEREPEMVG